MAIVRSSRGISDYCSCWPTVVLGRIEDPHPPIVHPVELSRWRPVCTLLRLGQAPDMYTEQEMHAAHELVDCDIEYGLVEQRHGTSQLHTKVLHAPQDHGVRTMRETNWHEPRLPGDRDPVRRRMRVLQHLDVDLVTILYAINLVRADQRLLNSPIRSWTYMYHDYMRLWLSSASFDRQ